ncbi:MAG TPA: PIG-L family deacetylase [Rhodocyclaceae bacterium]|nr:PIG-L family deacetylase [Rhodocyclaceae bacterium]
MTDLPPSGTLLALSPHLDDAVFACGRLLASTPGAIVATIFAGRPPQSQPLTDWDRAAGFSPGDDVVGIRREEDRAALDILGAQPRWLNLRDSQYGGADAEEVGKRLRELLSDCRPDTVLIPLGLFHSDHRVVHEAALSLLVPDTPCRWLAYEDALYRRIDGLRDAAIEALKVRGLDPQPVSFRESPQAELRKAGAVACYRSQLRALATPGRPGVADLEAPEAYWQLSPPPRSQP